MAKDNSWEIEIKAPFGGFAPAWYKNTYPFIGNKNHASDMNAIDLRDPNVLRQGSALSNLTAGTQEGAVSTLIKHIAKIVSSNNVAYAVGGAKLYKISATAVTNSGDFPHTINHPTATSEDAECVVNFQNNLYYFYNHNSGGDVGKFDLSSTFDDDWGSTTPTGAGSLLDAPHHAIVGADKLFFANGRYIGTYDGTTFDVGSGSAGLDFKAGSEVASLAYTNGWIHAAVNYPSVAGSNSNEAVIYIWDGESDSWETSIQLEGRIGALLSDNGIVYVWYEEENQAGGYKLGYINGNRVEQLETYDGSMPLFYQVAKNLGFLTWVSGGKIYCWGTASQNNLPPVLFELMDGGYATVGAIGNPFGTLLVASTDGGSNFRLASESGYDVNSDWYTIMFDGMSGDSNSMIDEVIVNHYKMGTGARVDVSLLTDFDTTATALGTISNAIDGASAIRKTLDANVECDNFRLRFNYANGSTSQTVQIRRILIKGHFTNKE